MSVSPPLAAIRTFLAVWVCGFLLMVGARAGETVVYRCTLPDGEISFTALPCGAAATPVIVRPSSPASSSPAAAAKQTREARVVESPQSFALRQQRLAQIESELHELAREREALRSRHADERMALATREPPADVKPTQRAIYEKARVREREGVERRQMKEMVLLEKRVARLERERARLLRPSGER